MENEIFVFGSNEAGRHGAGSALHARRNYGAIYGQGVGLQGRSYGIPTKDRNLKVLSLEQVRSHVDAFIGFARSHPELTFKVVDIGCGLAGYTPGEVAPMFRGAPDNCCFSDVFAPIVRHAAMRNR